MSNSASLEAEGSRSAARRVELAAAPTLRVLESPSGITDTAPTPRPRLRLVNARARILVASGDEQVRSLLRAEAARSDPNAVVIEADDAWGLLQRAPRSSLVMLGGDLRDAPAPAVSKLLAHRHPDLPIRDSRCPGNTNGSEATQPRGRGLARMRETAPGPTAALRPGPG